MFDTHDVKFEERIHEVAPEDLIEELAAVLAHRSRLDARAARLLAQIDQIRAHDRDGYTSRTAMLKHRMSLHPGEAQRMVMRANALTSTPLVAAAHDRGELTSAQVDLLLEARGTAPDPFAEAEADLAAIALETPLIRDLQKELDYWLDRVARDDLGAQRDLARELRSLTLRRDRDMVRINGWVDIESGERLEACLDPGVAGQDDDRSAPARRADLLIEIVDGASRRPGIVVHVSADTLDGPTGLSETSRGTFLTGLEVERIACEATITRVVLGPDSLPLDVGRANRLVTPAIRTALVARDRRCVFPTCDRHSHWCDVHHLTHWSKGGETSVCNCVLLCRYHHTLVHEGGWRIEGEPGSLRFVRPDGTELGNGPKPSVSRPAPVVSSERTRPTRDQVHRALVNRPPRGP